METVIAGDLGGTNLRAAVVDEDGEIRVRRQIATPDAATTGEIATAITGLFSALRDEFAGEPRAVCVAMAGLVDADDGRVLLSPNIAGVRDLRLADALHEAVQIPAFIENDASAAALGEYRFGAGQGVRHLLHVTLGTGIGGGIVVDGHLYRGAHGLAGEVGHVIIEPGGPRCNCGSRGCLEAVASGSAFARRAAELIAGGKSEQLRAMTQGRTPTGEDLYDAAVAGDAICEAEIRHGGHLLGLGIGGFVNILDPGRVTLSGGLLAMGEMLLGPMDQALRSLSYGPAAGAAIVPGTLGDDAGLLGAAAVAFERLATRG